MHAAACSKEVGVIHALVEAGAEVDAQKACGITLLYAAAVRGCREPVVVLAGYGADRDKTIDEAERTILHLAAAEGSCVAVENLLSIGADIAARYGAEEYPALDCAVVQGFAAMVKLLVERGTDVNAATSKGTTALHRAVSAKEANLIRALVEMGAEIDAQDEEGLTPLMGAVWAGDFQATAALLRHGANVNARDMNQENALRWATAIPNLETAGPLVTLLLEWDVDETVVNTGGLHASAQLTNEHSIAIDDLRYHDADGPEDRLWKGSVFRIRDQIERAPADRRTRKWLRRRLLVLWRSYPGRFQVVEKIPRRFDSQRRAPSSSLLYRVGAGRKGRRRPWRRKR